VILLVARMRRMVGAEHIDGAIDDRLPDARTVGLIAHGRIHLRATAKALITVGRNQRQMMRRHFHRGPALVLGQIVHLVARRDVKHVHTAAMLLRQLDKAAGCDQSCLGIAPDRVRRWIARNAFAHARNQTILILGVECRPTAELCDDLVERRFILDQKIARR
jgi:hypothetical protein